MAIAALQASRGMGAVRERGTGIFVAIGAQGVDVIGFLLLGVRIVAGLALNAGFRVLAGAPFIRRGFMAGGA
jgi:hypothetical protein